MLPSYTEWQDKVAGVRFEDAQDSIIVSTARYLSLDSLQPNPILSCCIASCGTPTLARTIGIRLKGRTLLLDSPFCSIQFSDTVRLCDILELLGFLAVCLLFSFQLYL